MEMTAWRVMIGPTHYTTVFFDPIMDAQEVFQALLDDYAFIFHVEQD